MDSIFQAPEANDLSLEIERNSDALYNSLTEDEILDKLAISRFHAEQGLYRDAEDVLADIREKNF